MSNIFTVTLNPAVDRELFVPTIQYDQVLRAIEQSIDFGGKGFNVSRMLKSLGKENTALGFVGGRSGELLQEGLESLGIKTDFTWISGETRTNVSIRSQNDTHYIKVNEAGPFITEAEQQALMEKIHERCQPGDWWIFAGSLPPGVASNFYADLISVVHQKAAHAVLDTSGEALMFGVQAQPEIIKPNEFELEKLSGQPVKSLQDITSAVQALSRFEIKHIVVSLGKRGALVGFLNEFWLVKSPIIEEENPIGAGDSTVGGLVWALDQDYDFLEAVRWGVACGTAAASLNGTAVGSYDLVRRLLFDVTLEPITQ